MARVWAPLVALALSFATVAFSDASSDALPPAVKDAGAAIGAVQEEADQRRLRGASVEEKSEVEDTGVVASERALSEDACETFIDDLSKAQKCPTTKPDCILTLRNEGCTEKKSLKKCNRWCK